ncbi:hypothetical protein QT327_10520 [Olivibacter sp. 47]|uniref:hypothetical protein n=1 Tax=Olivibacter sp. 47 TaxID=3056486 RepID=UPI0025A41955|nr:hypothetical protein [Olivibacter sp. 47]MDM8174785.1 hypothetical protein [Olivibacter sp. 47]
MDKTIKTAFDGINEIYQVFIAGNFAATTGLTGQVSKQSRMLNSKMEDVVISCLVLSAEQIQDGIFNVNIHVPNLENLPSGIPNAVDNTQPNYDRLNELGSAAIELLDDSWLYNSHFYLERAGEIIPESKGHFFNIRIRYHALRQDRNN